MIISTPKPLLALVRHLGGTDRLHSRRALATSGEALGLLTASLKAIVLDEADALLLDRELALHGQRGARTAARATAERACRAWPRQLRLAPARELRRRRRRVGPAQPSVNVSLRGPGLIF